MTMIEGTTTAATPGTKADDPAPGSDLAPVAPGGTAPVESTPAEVVNHPYVPDPREADAIRLRFETDDPTLEAVWLIELANEDDVLDRPEYPPGEPVITHFRYGGRWYLHPGVDHSSPRETDAPPRPRVE